ncbi:MAG: prepilin-type N-terminal cleavage/methylation domain-containing protein [Candidatus Omnitrophica bacterium]|nr:prepilin-type N-terminal cleavage/methylation domain-containing protein [Candidatus Omnitrophota bacterium]
MKYRCRHKEGFTIIELTIVMIVIAAILSAVLFAGQSTTDASRVTSALASVKSLQTAAVSFYNNNGGSYSGLSLSTLASGGYLPANFTSGTNQNPWKGNITVAPDSSNANYFDITFTNVPSSAATSLTAAVTKIAQSAPAYTASSQTWTAAF